MSDTEWRRFEYVTYTSSKFWQVRIEGQVVHVLYGKIGATGQTNAKPFNAVSHAEDYMRDKISEKLNKGYTEVQYNGPSGLPRNVGNPSQPKVAEPAGPTKPRRPTRSLSEVRSGIA